MRVLFAPEQDGEKSGFAAQCYIVTRICIETHCGVMTGPLV